MAGIMDGCVVAVVVVMIMMMIVVVIVMMVMSMIMIVVMMIVHVRVGRAAQPLVEHPAADRDDGNARDRA